jgi:GNAT superfamily N-acetyltransferase
MAWAGKGQMMKGVDAVTTPLGETVIHRAEAADLLLVAALFDDVMLWLTSIGLDGQWGSGPLPMDPEQLPEEWKRGIEAGEQYLAILLGRPVAAFRLHFDAPVERWGKVADDAGYVSGLVVRPAVSGLGIGRLLLDWAGRQSKQQGKRFLRLDCWADNARLCAYYEAAGFQPRGEYHFNDEWRGRLFEKPL